MTGPVLELTDVTRRFGGFTAVDRVDLSVAANTIHSVIGPNGAGKSTLFKLISGILRPSEGTVRFDGDDITGLRPHRVARRGLSQSFQVTSLFLRLTVLENVQAAIVAKRRRSADIVTWFHWSTRREALEMLDRVGLAAAAERPAQVLSHGDQRALEMAVALAQRHEADLIIAHVFEIPASM